ncbi:nitrogen permease regulator 2, partial [Meira miltonrushii]
MSDTYEGEGESEYSYTSSSEFGLSSEDERQANIQPEEDYFPPIVAIFYSIFHPTKGPTVIFQVPEGSIYSSSSKEQSTHAPLFDFRDLSEYIVPRAPLCGRLITYSTTSQEGQSYKVLSHPVLLIDQQKYPRNSFIFNLAFVFDGRADVRAYEPIVRKCARELKDLEQNSSFLSRSQFRMYELIEQLFEDLNSYYESFDPATTVRDAINVKLFPTYTNPKEVNDWDVPVTLLDLSRRISDNWDLTMRKVLPFVDGINHVKRISQLADADIELTRQCIEHLLYYRCIILIDTFQFTNMYTVRPTIAILAEDEIIMNECAAYVTRRGYALPTWPKLLSLYSSLRPSVTLNEWIEENDIDSVGIDVRRFVTFGVIKGFLRRVHRYP